MVFLRSEGSIPSKDLARISVISRRLLVDSSAAKVSAIFEKSMQPTKRTGLILLMFARIQKSLSVLCPREFFLLGMRDRV